MTTLPLPIIAFLMIAAFSSTAGADEPRSKLVTFDEVERKLGDPALRLIDVRPRSEYDQGHIPGAVWIDAKGIESTASKPGALSDAKVWEPWVAKLGLDAKSEVLIYDGKKQLDAARLWWLLSYLGVENVGLIDGNFPLWQTQKRPITAEVAKIEAKPFRIQFHDERHATRSEVLKALESKKVAVLDARSIGEFNGVEKRSKRSGHIPNACSLEWSNLVDESGKFLQESVLRQKLKEAGLKHGEPVITHCQGGGRASVSAFVLERLGFSTRNYYRGWSDWGNADDTPIEEKAAPAETAKP